MANRSKDELKKERKRRNSAIASERKLTERIRAAVEHFLTSAHVPRRDTNIEITVHQPWYYDGDCGSFIFDIEVVAFVDIKADAKLSFRIARNANVAEYVVATVSERGERKIVFRATDKMPANRNDPRICDGLFYEIYQGGQWEGKLDGQKLENILRYRTRSVCV